MVMQQTSWWAHHLFVMRSAPAASPQVQPLCSSLVRDEVGAWRVQQETGNLLVASSTSVIMMTISRTPSQPPKTYQPNNNHITNTHWTDTHWTTSNFALQKPSTTSNGGVLFTHNKVISTVLAFQ